MSSFGGGYYKWFLKFFSLLIFLLFYDNGGHTRKIAKVQIEKSL